MFFLYSLDCCLHINKDIAYNATLLKSLFNKNYQILTMYLQTYTKEVTYYPKQRNTHFYFEIVYGNSVLPADHWFALASVM